MQHTKSQILPADRQPLVGGLSAKKICTHFFTFFSDAMMMILIGSSFLLLHSQSESGSTITLGVGPAACHTNFETINRM